MPNFNNYLKGERLAFSVPPPPMYYLKSNCRSLGLTVSGAGAIPPRAE